ncbi:hypothetical protein MHB40_24150 [Lysinibacillus sp. FSL K6-0057]|uniref:hypothetical protein n=1 Tax=unclassified Lysinibacillus TaxID=2636778 RepID=UPI0031595A1A
MVSSLEEKRIKDSHHELRNIRLKHGITKKTDLEEVLSSYLNGNYRLAFLGAYIYLITPIAINSKRLYKNKNKRKFDKKEDPYKFNLIKALEECTFLNSKVKEELGQYHEIHLKSLKNNKNFIKNLSLSRIRNITVHPEDDLHKLLKEQLDYKKFTLLLLQLAPVVHREYQNYFNSNNGKLKRKSREKQLYLERIC